VLDGATETLKRCVGVQLELPIGHLYEGVWSFREALDYMDGLGFVLAQTCRRTASPMIGLQRSSSTACFGGSGRMIRSRAVV
jgi:hypothetical protein